MRAPSRLGFAFFLVLLMASTPVAVVSPAVADAPGWVLYTHPDKLMSVRFPGKSAEQDRKGKSPDGGTLDIKVATFIDGDRMFVATATVYPDTPKFDVKTALDIFVDDLVGKFKGRVVTQKGISVDGFQGREVHFEAPGPYKKPLRGSARIFVSSKPPTAYLAWTMQMDGKADPDAQRFLESVHLGKNVETRR